MWTSFADKRQSATAHLAGTIFAERGKGEEEEKRCSRRNESKARCSVARLECTNEMDVLPGSRSLKQTSYYRMR